MRMIYEINQTKPVPRQWAIEAFVGTSVSTTGATGLTIVDSPAKGAAP